MESKYVCKCNSCGSLFTIKPEVGYCPICKYYNLVDYELPKWLTDKQRDIAAIEFCKVYFPYYTDITKETEVFDAGIQWGVEHNPTYANRDSLLLNFVQWFTPRSDIQNRLIINYNKYVEDGKRS